MGVGLSICDSMIEAHRGVSGRQLTMSQDAPWHSLFHVTKVPNPLRSNDLRGVLPARNQYLSTMDTARHTADDYVVRYLQEGARSGQTQPRC
jgi:hypothetical protein